MFNEKWMVQKLPVVGGVMSQDFVPRHFLQRAQKRETQSRSLGTFDFCSSPTKRPYLRKTIMLRRKRGNRDVTSTFIKTPYLCELDNGVHFGGYLPQCSPTFLSDYPLQRSSIPARELRLSPIVLLCRGYLSQFCVGGHNL